MKKAFAVLSMVIFGGMMVYNCEPEPDSLGEQLFLDGAANGTEVAYDVIAYNISNNDSVRSDASKLGMATIGAFREGQFGDQKAAYYTQLRLAADDPDFGANATVDSVVLVIKPTFASDSLTTTTNENYVYPDGAVPARQVINRYPAVKFGKAKANNGKLTVKVHEVTEFLDGYNDIAYSNKIYGYDSANPIGTKEFDGFVKSISITRDSDNTSLFSSEVGFRMALSPTFFKSKIIDKKGQPELKDVANFIRYFRGLRISVEENDGYLLQFAPSSVELLMYYKSDLVVDGVTTKPQTKYTFSIGNGNVHIGNYIYDRAGSALQTTATGNTSTGDSKLFAQGMGGNSIGIKFPQSTINQLKTLYQNNKAAIISAKIRMYTDPDSWNNKYTKPNLMTIVQKDVIDGKPSTNFTEDILKLSGTPNFLYLRAYNLDKNPAYYDFTVTQSVKDIVESGANYIDKYFKIDMGNFLRSADGSALAGYQFTSRAYSVDRAVFVGTDSTNPDNDPSKPYEIKLRVTYGNK